MLERPQIQDSQIITCLRIEYRLDVLEVSFLPIGADRHTAVFRATVRNRSHFFVKLRSGNFDETSIIVPKLLHEQGNQHVIAPLSTHSNHLWAILDDYIVTVFPYIEGYCGAEIDLLDRHWIEFGLVLKSLHTAEIPSTVADRIPREQYAGRWREGVREFQTLVENIPFVDPVASELASLMMSKRAEIDTLIRRAAYLASVLKTKSEPFVLCHADAHVWNILIDTENHLFLVDWDTLILAPKERDLMFVGGGLFLNKRSAEEEEHLFFTGYGQVEIDPIALVYFRCERIIQDIAAYCEQLLLTNDGGEDRKNGLQQLMDQFGKNDVIEMAFRTEMILPDQYRFK